MASSTRGLAASLLKRFSAVLRDWPVDTSRKGRDLAEHLHNVYPKNLKKIAGEDVSGAELKIDPA